MLGDIRVLDRRRVVERAPFDPLCCDGGARDRGPTPECLEARVCDVARLRVDADLELHDVAACGGTHQPGADIGVGLVERADVARALVVVDDLRMICYF